MRGRQDGLIFFPVCLVCFLPPERGGCAVRVDAEETERTHGRTPGTGACVDSPLLGGVCVCTPSPDVLWWGPCRQARGGSGPGAQPLLGRQEGGGRGRLLVRAAGLRTPCCVYETSVEFSLTQFGEFLKPYVSVVSPLS